MNKTQKEWYSWGYSDALQFKEHPESMFQEAWDVCKKDVDMGRYSWDTLFQNFPYYKKGIETLRKDLKLDY